MKQNEASLTDVNSSTSASWLESSKPSESFLGVGRQTADFYDAEQ